MTVEHYDSNPLEVLHQRLNTLGRLLSALCCLWIAVVGTVLIRDLTPDDLKHHRAPQIQDRVARCEGEFSQRYACADAILLNGQQTGAAELLARLGVTLILPTIAWTMWRGVMTRAGRLR